MGDKQPFRPIISDVEIRRETCPVVGPIEAGEVFAWMPDDPDQRQLVVVSRVDPHRLRILVWDFPHYWILIDHDEFAFRRGAYRTRFNLMPSEPRGDVWTGDFLCPFPPSRESTP